MKIFMERYGRYVVIAAAVLFVALSLMIFGPSMCSNRQAAEQAKQTSRSGEAIGSAAGVAIETMENRVVTEKAIDDAVANTQKEIGNAQDPDALRAAVISGVCRKASHRNDPACAVP